MYLSTFENEELEHSSNLIVKSLFLLAFISPTEDTNTQIRFHINREQLESLRYHSILSRYTILSLINPIGYTFVTKQLPNPHKRKGLNEDFNVIDTNILFDYFQCVDILSATIALN